MKDLFLNNNKGYRWFSNVKVKAKGCFFGQDNEFCQGEKIIDYFKDIRSFSDFEKKVSMANGLFSVVYRNKDELFAAVDPFRSFPLYYTLLNGKWLISDDPYKLAENAGLKTLNPLSEIEFSATGYTTGDATLIEGLYQIQAGESIKFQREEVQKRNYFSYRVHDPFYKNYDELITDAGDIITEVFQRFISGLNGRKVILPLSGGFDSRLIAVLLKHFEYKNVLCFTYGRKDSNEISYSRNVAKKLGFEWIYIEYSEELIRDYLFEKTFYEYYKYGGGLTSMFYMQEYFAIKYLKENFEIPHDCIFTPGFFGDFLGGSLLYKLGNIYTDETVDRIAKRIYRTRYDQKKPDRRSVPVILEKIKNILSRKFKSEYDLSYSIQEDWEFKERYAKFIVNSSAIYTFFGYEFRLPFCDLDLIEFFRRVPLEFKINKTLYDEVLTKRFFQEYGVDFGKELRVNASIVRRQMLKNKIKRYLPESFVGLFINRKDSLFYNEITRYMREDLRLRGIKTIPYGNTYNSIITIWYYYSVCDEFAKSSIL